MPLTLGELAIGGLEDDAFIEEEAELAGEGLAAVKIIIVGGGEDAAIGIDPLVEAIDGGDGIAIVVIGDGRVLVERTTGGRVALREGDIAATGVRICPKS